MHPKVQPAQGIFLFYQLMQPGRIRDAGLSGQDRTVQRKPGWVMRFSSSLISGTSSSWFRYLQASSS